MTNKVGMISLGCPKNQVDGEVMLEKLNKSGFEIAQSIEDSDVMIINTCGFIEDAKHMKRKYNNSVLMQKQIIKYGKMAEDEFGNGYVFSAKGYVNGKERLWLRQKVGGVWKK